MAIEEEIRMSNRDMSARNRSAHRVESHRARHMLDGLVRSARPYVDPSAAGPGEGQVGVQRQRPGNLFLGKDKVAQDIGDRHGGACERMSIVAAKVNGEPDKPHEFFTLDPGVTGQTPAPSVDIEVKQHSERACVCRVQHQGAPEQACRFVDVFRGGRHLEDGQSPQIAVIRIEICRRFAFGSLHFGPLNSGCEGANDLFGHGILQAEHVFERTIEAVRP
jgi:hypothetical protein